MGKLNKSIFPQSMIAEVRLRYVPDYFMDHLTLRTADKFSGFSGDQGLTKYLFARTTIKAILILKCIKRKKRTEKNHFTFHNGQTIVKCGRSNHFFLPFFTTESKKKESHNERSHYQRSLKARSYYQRSWIVESDISKIEWLKKALQHWGFPN